VPVFKRGGLTIVENRRRKQNRIGERYDTILFRYSLVSVP